MPVAARASTAIRRLAARHPRTKAVLKAVRFMPLVVSDRVWRLRHRRALGELGTQPTLVLQTTLSTAELTDPAQLEARFTGVRRGSNALYIPPQDGLAATFGLPFTVPPSAGVKLLLDFRPPAAAQYLHPDKASAARNAVSGSTSANALAGNYLFVAGLGPRIWDVVELRSAEGEAGTAFLVDHVATTKPTDDADCASFVAALDGAIGNELTVTYPGWRTTGDFGPPDCNGNLLIGAQGPRYVDFQNFRVDQIAWLERLSDVHSEVSHFGETRIGRPDRYLYQNVPGLGAAAKRNVSRRWDRLAEALAEVGVEPTDRLLLDIGTNIGMILHHGLAAGAAWGLGWDHPAVARAAEDLQLALGNSRIELCGAELDEEHDFATDLRPELRAGLAESVIFYLSVHRHIGFPSWIREGHWRALVYEGHDGESVTEAAANARRLVGQGPAITPVRMGTDGDSGRRPYCVAVRAD